MKQTYITATKQETESSIIDFGHFFRTLPRVVNFPLGNKKLPPHGLSWIGSDEDLPQEEEVFAKILGATAEEIEALNNNDGTFTREILKDCSMYDLKKEKSTSQLECGWCVERASAKGQVIYLFRSKDIGLLQLGYADEKEFPSLADSLGVLTTTLHDIDEASFSLGERPSFFNESAGDVFERPWNFTFLSASTLPQMQKKTASFLAMLDTPDSLWVVCQQTMDEWISVTGWTLIENGKKNLSEPEQNFEAIVTSGKAIGKPPFLRMCFFWR